MVSQATPFAGVASETSQRRGSGWPHLVLSGCFRWKILILHLIKIPSHVSVETMCMSCFNTKRWYFLWEDKAEFHANIILVYTVDPNKDTGHSQTHANTWNFLVPYPTHFLFSSSENPGSKGFWLQHVYPLLVGFVMLVARSKLVAFSIRLLWLLQVL